MCVNCGCGQLSNTHGDPLNLTVSRFRLIALRNHSSMEKQAENILATLRGILTPEKPRGDDDIIVKLTRIEKKPKMEAHYVRRTFTKLSKSRKPKE